MQEAILVATTEPKVQKKIQHKNKVAKYSLLNTLHTSYAVDPFTKPLRKGR